MDDTMDDSKRNWVSHPLGIHRNNFYRDLIGMMTHQLLVIFTT